MSGAGTPTTTEPPPLDDRDVEPRTPMKRLGSTRKLAAFNSKPNFLCFIFIVKAALFLYLILVIVNKTLVNVATPHKFNIYSQDDCCLFPLARK